jgi:hypothetical protein
MAERTISDNRALIHVKQLLLVATAQEALVVSGALIAARAVQGFAATLGSMILDTCCIIAST